QESLAAPRQDTSAIDRDLVSGHSMVSKGSKVSERRRERAPCRRRFFLLVEMFVVVAQPSSSSAAMLPSFHYPPPLEIPLGPSVQKLTYLAGCWPFDDSIEWRARARARE